MTERTARLAGISSLSRPVRILCVVRNPVGGIRTYLKYVYAALPAGKYETTVVAVRSLESGQLSRDLSPLGIRCIEVPEDRPTMGLLMAIGRAVRRAAPHVIHSHGFTSGVIAALANLPYGLPHIVTSHDVFRREQFEGTRGRLKARGLAAMLRRADVVQSVSRDAQENLLAYLPGFSPSSLAVISNGIAVEHFQGAAGPQPLRATEPDAPALFGFFGRLMPQKGFGDLVDAVARLDGDDTVRNRFQVRVVSDGGYIREHRAAIAVRGLSHYFDFTGFVPDISSALSQVDAVVMPSLWEACPLVPMEALVAGCPLIASTCIGLREVIDGTPAVAVAPESPDELARAMRDLIGRPDVFRARARQFMPEAARRFDVRRAADSLDALIDTTLARRGQAPVHELLRRGA